MKNCIQDEAGTVELPAPADVVSGQFVVVGSVFGVVVADAKSGALMELRRHGIFEKIPKTTADTFSAGDPLYWKTSTSKLTTTAAGNLLVGAAMVAGLNTDTETTLLLSQGIRAAEAGA